MPYSSIYSSLGRDRSYSPPRSRAILHDYEVPYVPLNRTTTRSSIPSWDFLGKTEYRRQSAALYPPDGYYLKKRVNASGYEHNRPWEKPILDSYYEYKPWNDSSKLLSKKYDTQKDSFKSREGTRRKWYTDLFPEDPTRRMYRPSATGLYSYEAHSDLRDRARRLESDAYRHAVKRTEHFSTYPRSSHGHRDDRMHYNSVVDAWDEHEKAAAALREHEKYGSKRRRDSCCNGPESSRDIGRRDRIFTRENEKRYYSKARPQPSRLWYSK